MLLSAAEYPDDRNTCLLRCRSYVLCNYVSVGMRGIHHEAGAHALRIEVTCAPVFQWRDPLSVHGWLPPAGRTGPIALLEAKEEDEP